MMLSTPLRCNSKQILSIVNRSLAVAAKGKKGGKKGGKGSMFPGKQEKESAEQIAQGKKDKKDSEAIYNFIDHTIRAERIKLDFSDDEKEEHKRIGREYNRQTSIRDALINKDLSTKIWLQQAAIEAIPTQKLLDDALIIDEDPPPADRQYPIYDTPPIPDFNIADYDGSNEKQDEIDDIDDEEDDIDLEALIDEDDVGGDQKELQKEVQNEDKT